MKFKVKADFEPSGDQPKAIRQIVSAFLNGKKRITLLGVTGSGKTFTMANVIAKLNVPTIVISHNKTLAAQLYREFKTFFPENSVEYFVSYYDYYQPEAYIPQTDTYIEKEVSINDEIDRLRISTVASLLDRRDVVVVASVSSIYGIGNPEEFKNFVFLVKVGQQITRDELLRKLVEMQYSRNDIDPARSSFRVRGDIVDIRPSYSRDVLRIEFFGDEVDRIRIVDAVSGRTLEELDKVAIYPAKIFMSSDEKLKLALNSIRQELKERLKELESQGKLLEAQRLKSRTLYDLELLETTGYCPGIENYSRHLSGRKPGERPFVLFDYFQKPYLTIIDESHITIPQLRGMYRGDRARKEVLVEHGFRLPSALDNRPLTFEEWDSMLDMVLYVSATPGDYELEVSEEVVEQIVRPTGLVDPEVIVKPTEGQIDDLLGEIKKVISRNERVIVAVLTKRMAEMLTNFLLENGIKAVYLHDEIETIERVEILRDLRLGVYDVIVGINLLREGIDLPEVSLVAILDADKVGFLRSDRSLIQLAGRSARNVNGRVIMYADRMSPAMKKAIEEMKRRRSIQIEYNQKHNITPQTVKKKVVDIIERIHPKEEHLDLEKIKMQYADDKSKLIEKLTDLMMKYAENLEFEKAAVVRDEIMRIKKKEKSDTQGG